jgi:vancomycin permeability regulator SanA
VFLFAPIRWAIKLVSLLITAAVIYVIVSGVQVVGASNAVDTASAVAPAAAIIVIGAPLVDGAPGPVLLARLEQALALYQATRAPRLVLTGATLAGGSEPASEESWLTARSVPRQALTAAGGGSVIDDLTAAARVLGSGTSAIVVTDAIDTLWTTKTAAALGLEVSVSPDPASKKFVFDEIGPLWRQATAVAAGRIIGYKHTTWAAR